MKHSFMQRHVSIVKGLIFRILTLNHNTIMESLLIKIFASGN